MLHHSVPAGLSPVWEKNWQRNESCVVFPRISGLLGLARRLRASLMAVNELNPQVQAVETQET